MILEKRINNNVVLALEKGQQLIVTGSGIGFQKYPGDRIPDEIIEKRYYSEGSLTIEQMASLVISASSEEVSLVDEIIEYGQGNIESSLNPNIFFTLLDHISFSLQRIEKNIEITSPLEWEIKKFYPTEYKIGKHAVQLIREKRNINLPDNEASLIALHFVNAQLESNGNYDAAWLTEKTKDILQLVKYHMKCDYEEESFHFQRFITHIRYSLMRLKSGNQVLADEDDELVRIIFERFPREKGCVDFINQYLGKQQGWKLSSMERMYMILHIHNLSERNN